MFWQEERLTKPIRSPFLVEYSAANVTGIVSPSLDIL